MSKVTISQSIRITVQGDADHDATVAYIDQEGDLVIADADDSDYGKTYIAKDNVKDFITALQRFIPAEPKSVVAKPRTTRAKK